MSWRTSSPVTPRSCEQACFIGCDSLLTVRAFSSLRVERACCLSTVAFFNFSNVAADEFMFLCETSCDPKLVKPGLTSLVLLTNPSGLDEISLACLNTSTVRVIQMSLSPQNLPVGVAARMRDNTRSQKDGGKGLCELNHD